MPQSQACDFHFVYFPCKLHACPACFMCVCVSAGEYHRLGKAGVYVSYFSRGAGVLVC